MRERGFFVVWQNGSWMSSLLSTWGIEQVVSERRCPWRSATSKFYWRYEREHWVMDALYNNDLGEKKNVGRNITKDNENPWSSYKAVLSSAGWQSQVCHLWAGWLWQVTTLLLSSSQQMGLKGTSLIFGIVTRIKWVTMSKAFKRHLTHRKCSIYKKIS